MRERYYERYTIIYNNPDTSSITERDKTFSKRERGFITRTDKDNDKVLG